MGHWIAPRWNINVRYAPVQTKLNTILRDENKQVLSVSSFNSTQNSFTFNPCCVHWSMTCLNWFVEGKLLRKQKITHFWYKTWIMYLEPCGECAKVLSTSISTALIKKVMDKIWDELPSQSDHWLLWRGWKNKWQRRTDKSRTLKKTTSTI